VQFGDRCQSGCNLGTSKSEYSKIQQQYQWHVAALYWSNSALMCHVTTNYWSTSVEWAPPWQNLKEVGPTKCHVAHYEWCHISTEPAALTSHTHHMACHAGCHINREATRLSYWSTSTVSMRDTDTWQHTMESPHQGPVTWQYIIGPPHLCGPHLNHCRNYSTYSSKKKKNSST
jgi:hypothetical protein